MINLYIDLTARELVDKVIDYYHYREDDAFADMIGAPREKIKRWIEENDVDAVIDFLEELGVTKELFNEKREVKLLRKANKTELAMENLADYFDIEHVRQLAKILDLNSDTLFEWRRKNQIGMLVDVVAKKEPKALEHLFPNEDSLKIKNIFLEHAKKKASLLGFGLSDYIENLIFNDLKK